MPVDPVGRQFQHGIQPGEGTRPARLNGKDSIGDQDCAVMRITEHRIAQ
ncbi:hypothetical protein NYR55_10295 [Sphingomonas sp. BGYR3]|nr:hypothetical protein [Sphingomonas sp. BGYR3]MDG5489004.1 hypothetical protein [Sphingomonas sp. BGYR3]